MNELVLLDARNLPLRAVSSVESNKLKHRFIGPFTVLSRHGAAYTIDLPESMATHPKFYVGRLKQYHDPNLVVHSEPQGRTRALEQPQSQAHEQPQGRSQSRSQTLGARYPIPEGAPNESQGHSNAKSTPGHGTQKMGKRSTPG